MKKLLIIVILSGVLVNSVYAGKVTGKLFCEMKMKEMYHNREIGHIHELNKNAPDINSQLVFIHFDSKPDFRTIEMLNQKGVQIFPKSWIPPLENHPTGYMTAKIPVNMQLLNELETISQIKRINTAEGQFKFNNDLAAENTGVSVISSEPYNLTGEGVKIAIIDSGFELDHEDIPTPLIAVDYSNYTEAVPDSDFTVSNAHTGTGHGTHIAGSIVGQGALSGGVWKGMAHGADWIGLKVGQDYTHAITTAALNHCYKTARFYYDADLVNASLGGWDVYHDGSDETDQIVDWISNDGCLVFQAAGNSGNDAMHYSGTLSGGSSSDFIAVNYNDTTETRATYIFNLVWYDSPDTTIQNPMTLEFYDDDYDLLTIQTVYEMTQSPRGTQSRYGTATIFGNNPIFIKVINQSGESLDYHLFSQSSNGIFADPDPFYTIESPGTADMAVAVGAWVTRNDWYSYNYLYCWTDEIVEDIGTFSSRGPRIDDYQKPNICAPGSMIISLRDDDAISGPPFGLWGPNVINNDGGTGLPADYLITQGTSCSSPIACGAAALLKDYDPLIDRTNLYVKLWNHASLDGYTDDVPNDTWGAGKINVEASLHALEEELTPLTPLNIQIECSDGNVTLSWDPVTETIGGRTITADYYKLYVYEDPYSPVYSTTYNVYDTSIQLSPGTDMYFYRISCVYNP